MPGSRFLTLFRPHSHAHKVTPLHCLNTLPRHSSHTHAKPTPPAYTFWHHWDHEANIVTRAAPNHTLLTALLLPLFKPLQASHPHTHTHHLHGTSFVFFFFLTLLPILLPQPEIISYFHVSLPLLLRPLGEKHPIFLHLSICKHQSSPFVLSSPLPPFVTHPSVSPSFHHSSVKAPS